MYKMKHFWINTMFGFYSYLDVDCFANRFEVTSYKLTRRLSASERPTPLILAHSFRLPLRIPSSNQDGVVLAASLEGCPSATSSSLALPSCFPSTFGWWSRHAFRVHSLHRLCTVHTYLTGRYAQPQRSRRRRPRTVYDFQLFSSWVFTLTGHRQIIEREDRVLNDFTRRAAAR